MMMDLGGGQLSVDLREKWGRVGKLQWNVGGNCGELVYQLVVFFKKTGVIYVEIIPLLTIEKDNSIQAVKKGTPLQKNLKK